MSHDIVETTHVLVECDNEHVLPGVKLWKWFGKVLEGFGKSVWDGFGKPLILVREGFGMFGMASGRVWEAANFEMLVSGAPGARNQHLLQKKKKPLTLKCWFLAPQAPETSIWAPEGAFGPKKAIFPSFFHDFFGLFSKYLAPSGAKYREKGWAVAKTGEW